MWIGEQIDEYGIGNGISLIIMAGIIARLPWAVQDLARLVKFSVGGSETGAHWPGKADVFWSLLLCLLLRALS